MSVIVNEEMPIDLALRLLWREATREGIIEKLQGRRYFVSQTEKNHAVRKVFSKMKKRRRQAARKGKTSR